MMEIKCPDNVRDVSRDLAQVIFAMHSEIKGTGLSYFSADEMLRDIEFIKNRLNNWEPSFDQVEINFKQICELVLSRFESLFVEIHGNKCAE